MCRLYGFRSSIVSGVHQSLVAAENALGRQSVFHPDGWGVAYYVERYPHLLRSDKQALADGLFREVSAVVSTRTLLAHIRQATVGETSVLNCHPFQHGPWSFAHNGEISGFATSERVRTAARDAVDPRFRRYILGATDSEVCFYIFLSRLSRAVEDIYHEGIRVETARQALLETVELLVSIDDNSASEPSKLTFLLTNGSMLIAYRHRRELFYSTYKTSCPERDSCPAYEAYRCEAPVQDGLVKHLILASEQPSAGPNVWIPMKDGDFVSVDHGMFFQHGRLFEGAFAGSLPAEEPTRK